MKIKNILVGDDFTQNSTEAIALSFQLAKRLGVRPKIYHIDSAPRMPYRMPAFSEVYSEKLLKDIDEAVSNGAEKSLMLQLKELGISRNEVEAHIIPGEIPKEFKHLTENLEAPLLILGGRGPNKFEYLLLGSVADKLIRTLTCPILITKNAPKNFKKILFSTDFGQTSKDALELLMDIAPVFEAEVHVVHFLEPVANFQALTDEAMAFHSYSHTEENWVILDEEEAKNTADEKLNSTVQALEKKGIKATGEIFHSDGQNLASQVLSVCHSFSADLITVGTHGRSGIQKFIFGSVAEKIARESKASVLIVRGARTD